MECLSADIEEAVRQYRQAEDGARQPHQPIRPHLAHRQVA